MQARHQLEQIQQLVGFVPKAAQQRKGLLPQQSSSSRGSKRSHGSSASSTGSGPSPCKNRKSFNASMKNKAP